MSIDQTLISIVVGVFIAIVGTFGGTVWAMKHLSSGSKMEKLEDQVGAMQAKLESVTGQAKVDVIERLAKLEKDLRDQVMEGRSRAHNELNAQTEHINDVIWSMRQALVQDIDKQLERHRTMCKDGLEKVINSKLVPLS